MAKVQVVKAEDVVIENVQTGASSQNVSEAKIENNTTIEAVNQGETVSQINLNLNTGNNQTNQNNQGVNVDTGDITASVEVENKENINQIDLESVSNDTDIKSVNENTGAQSQNTAQIDINQATSYSSQNISLITNQTDVNANTGDNQANQNNGNVDIQTGEINVELKFQANTNISKIEIPQCVICLSAGGVNAQNLNTGPDSVNQSSVNIGQQNLILLSNILVIRNSIQGDFNTGGNQGNENNGDVHIASGDINIAVSVDNHGNINVIVDPKEEDDPGTIPPIGGTVDEEEEKTPAPEVPAQQSTTTSSNNSSSGSGSGSSGSSSPAIGGQVLGAMLPATGSPYTIMMWLTGLFLISMGRYVRLLSGRAPAFALAN